MMMTRACMPSARAIATSCICAMDSSRISRRGEQLRPTCASRGAQNRSMAPRSTKMPRSACTLPATMFSATVRFGKRSSSWKMMPMPRRWASSGLRKSTRLPSRKMPPESGAITPAITLPSVLLPAPFSPTSAWTSPADTSRLTSASACVPSKCLLTRSTRSRLITQNVSLSYICLAFSDVMSSVPSMYFFSGLNDGSCKIRPPISMALSTASG